MDANDGAGTAGHSDADAGLPPRQCGTLVRYDVALPRSTRRGVGPVHGAVDAFAIGFAADTARRRGPGPGPGRSRSPPMPVLKAGTGGSPRPRGGRHSGRPRNGSVRPPGSRTPCQWRSALPDIVKPSHELLGETLLSLGRPGEARVAFERALDLAPGRLRALVGLYRAAVAEGDSMVARRARTKLEPVLRTTDADPELEEFHRIP